MSITTEIFEAFENLDETRAVFLDISKAFDKVWHEGLCFKLKQNGINGNLLVLMSSFLSDRKQKVILNDTSSDWKEIYSGVPQGSVLGPLLFLIYINDLTDDIKSNIRLFADDSSLFIRVRSIEEAQALLSSDLETITSWAHQWKMQFNPDITKAAIEVIFSSRHKKNAHIHLLVATALLSLDRNGPNILAFIWMRNFPSKNILQRQSQKQKRALPYLNFYQNI